MEKEAGLIISLIISQIRNKYSFLINCAPQAVWRHVALAQGTNNFLNIDTGNAEKETLVQAYFTGFLQRTRL